jgi:hypothetical protein
MVMTPFFVKYAFPLPLRRDSARAGTAPSYGREHRAPQRQRLGRVMLIYIIETPKDSLRLSFGLAVSCALSCLWYYCEPLLEDHEWKNEEKQLVTKIERHGSVCSDMPLLVFYLSLGYNSLAF